MNVSEAPSSDKGATQREQAGTAIGSAQCRQRRDAAKTEHAQQSEAPNAGKGATQRRPSSWSERRRGGFQGGATQRPPAQRRPGGYFFFAFLVAFLGAAFFAFFIGMGLWIPPLIVRSDLPAGALPSAHEKMGRVIGPPPLFPVGALTSSSSSPSWQPSSWPASFEIPPFGPGMDEVSPSSTCRVTRGLTY